MSVALAFTYHDPKGRMYLSWQQTLPAFRQLFDEVVVQLSRTAYRPSVELFEHYGALMQHDSAHLPPGKRALGAKRRHALSLALQTSCPLLLLCDGDRILHWVQRYPEELAAVVAGLGTYDCTIFGRTARAFATHSRVQRETEAIIDHVYCLVSGHQWDVTAAARGFSQRAASAIVREHADDTIGNDVSWPLFLQQRGGFSLGYVEVEGLERETADRYQEEVKVAGGVQQWTAAIDTDPRIWADRLEGAYLEVVAMLPYTKIIP
jgi:hypothetical protein